MARTEKVPALKLTLGGAPATAHTVDGLAGFYHPEIPTPVDGPGEATLEQAKDYHDRDGAAVELVYITPKEAEDARAWQQEQRLAAAGALRTDSGATQQQIDATADALTGDAGETTDTPEEG